RRDGRRRTPRVVAVVEGPRRVVATGERRRGRRGERWQRPGEQIQRDRAPTNRRRHQFTLLASSFQFVPSKTNVRVALALEPNGPFNFSVEASRMVALMSVKIRRMTWPLRPLAKAVMVVGDDSVTLASVTPSTLGFVDPSLSVGMSLGTHIPKRSHWMM